MSGIKLMLFGLYILFFWILFAICTPHPGDDIPVVGFLTSIAPLMVGIFMKDKQSPERGVEGERE